jgi:hypothetical protein
MPVQVFISYRRSDASSAARQLAEALKLRSGAEDVFFDTSDIAAGVEWRSDAIRRVRAADIVPAVIGPHWAAAADKRTRRSLLDRADEDLVRLEIETAFTPGAIVIPVLVDDAEMPSRDMLQRPFRALAEAQAQTLRHISWDRDVDALAEALAYVAEQPRLPLEARSWTVAPAVDLVERELWDRFGVHVVEEPVAEFLKEVEHALGRLTPINLKR